MTTNHYPVDSTTRRCCGGIGARTRCCGAQLVTVTHHLSGQVVVCRRDRLVDVLCEAGWFADGPNVTDAISALGRAVRAGVCVDGYVRTLGLTVEEGIGDGDGDGAAAESASAMEVADTLAAARRLLVDRLGYLTREQRAAVVDMLEHLHAVERSLETLVPGVLDADTAAMR